MENHRRGTTRRSFLKATAAGLALGLSGRPSLAAAEHNLVVISGDPAAATRKALEGLGGISHLVRKGQRVVLKPNMSFPNPPERASATHPLVVTTVAQACMDAGAERVVVLDFPLHKTELCLQRSGIQEACKAIRGVHVLGLDERKFFRVQYQLCVGRPGHGHQAAPHHPGCRSGPGLGRAGGSWGCAEAQPDHCRR